MAKSGFGKFIVIGGKGWQGPSTAVPLPLLQQMARNVAIPQTISTLVVSIPGSVTRPVPLWIGNDFQEVKESLSYTVEATGAGGWMINTSGVAVSTGVITAATIYYMYVGMDSDGTLEYYPSSSPPSHVQGPFGSSAVWAHPGTTRDKHWAYTGFFQATTTVPALAQLTKRGFIYSNPVPTAMGLTNLGQDTTVPAFEDFSTMVPKHGVECSGWMSGATDAIGTETFIGSDSLSAQQFVVSCNSLAVTSPPNTNFGPVIPDSSGYLWSMSAVSNHTGGKANITTIKDVV